MALAIVEELGVIGADGGDVEGATVKHLSPVRLILLVEVDPCLIHVAPRGANIAEPRQRLQSCPAETDDDRRLELLDSLVQKRLPVLNRLVRPSHRIAL